MRLVLLPGLHGSGRLFRLLAESLPPWLDPIVVSYPSHVSSYVELLPVVRSSFPAGEQFVLVAESFSGPLAVLAAAERPESLAGLVLAASFARAPWSCWISPLRPLMRAPLLRCVPWPLVARVLLGPGSRSSQLAEELRRAISATPVAVLAGRLREVLRVNVIDQLGTLEVPILYLAAERDVLVTRSSVRLIERYARNIRVVRMDAPHLLLQVAPAEAAREISQFAAKAAAF